MSNRYTKNIKANDNGDSSNSLASIVKQNSMLSFLTGVYIFFWFMQMGYRSQLYREIRFEFMLGSFLTVAAIFSLMTNKDKIANEIKAPALILIFYFLLFVVLSVDMAHSWNIFFTYVVKYSLLALFIVAFVNSLPKLKFIMICFFAAITKLGQEGVTGWLSGALVWENQGIPRLHGAIDRLTHPNSFSGFAVSMLPFIYYYYKISSPKLKLFLGVLGCCMLIIIMATGSRTGYVATILLTIIAFWQKLKKNLFKALISMALLVTIVVVLLPDSYMSRFESIYTQEEVAGNSTGARLQIIEDAIDVFVENPMGVGIGAFPLVRMEMFGRHQDTHNLYLEILTNSGFIGLFLFFFLIIRILKVNKLVLRMTQEHEDEFMFIRATVCALIGYLLARLFLGMFGMDMYEIYWWFAAGLTIACYNIVSKKLNAIDGLKRRE